MHPSLLCPDADAAVAPRAVCGVRAKGAWKASALLVHRGDDADHCDDKNADDDDRRNHARFSQLKIVVVPMIHGVDLRSLVLSSLLSSSLVEACATGVNIERMTMFCALARFRRPLFERPLTGRASTIGTFSANHIDQRSIFCSSQLQPFKSISDS
jgi:hypothetical protein